ncbi:DUF4266 domain-containing protein [Actimicrobium sp. CCC2.4]|uniref:DUF4266 domain-containing protein n=1 Tax=Actimicrobium sp. CCC2.4 TaxID=3048606 RepID=UPI002AC99671|nr:DUF4266 domain-containing protein [Actimicrobium sp. CCC2.4]MEB0134164.1 DUF4266 domain-containing protein [Actimicrobium sp. CCC2.4]WPX32818.1 DUF4266 domain-containing protein [Actimicrobium sp. CCC2.4]
MTYASRQRPGATAALVVLAGLIAPVLLGGCNNLAQVHPWEKGKLAKAVMRFDDNPLEQRFDQHIYSSKEGASGGYSVGGGGCGCN